MKFSLLALVIFSFSTTLAEKTCTPSFDYCADELLQSRGFTEVDLKDALKDSEFENEDFRNILFHCKNPGIVGHPKHGSSFADGNFVASELIGA
ncbi:uncharacterized protein ATNIH1004_003953 [Aspergillus tanneri]|uniref:Uncharacterized protein n=1 Tax=Aspergillus tanneri TaxID=1220188 RepID=A0A5M9MRY0_9EURO|nr:uncharacterized protein ATNIH1004_003953 [Aspergillus tanneri]KAA8648070.1 hypothetical protein ATNIH1004_003953 [Aspergillus tanneri]